MGILLLSFGIYKILTPTVRIEWMTESEVDTLGFNLLRQDLTDPENGQIINEQLILAQGSPISGTSYHYMDRDVQPGKSYIYHLQEINNNNEIVDLESIEISIKHKGSVEIGIGLVLLATAILLYIKWQKTYSGNQS